MKKLGITLLLLLFATTAYAEIKFELTGDMKGAGTYYQNHDMASDDTVSYSYYDGDLNLYPKIIVGDSSVNMKLAIRDETWREGVYDTDDTTELDNNVAVERCFLQHKFTENTTLDVGLMDGGTWGTTFGDNKAARYRVKVTQMTDVGAVVALVEKMAEVGSTATSTEDAEKDDADNFAIGFVTKIDKIKIAPLFYYLNLSRYDSGGVSYYLDNGNDALKRLLLALEISGDLGAVAFEAELDYNNYDSKGFVHPLAGALEDNDWTAIGFYLNVWAPLDAAKVGGVLAYGSYDDEGGPASSGFGFDFNDDFYSTVILGDELGWGGGEDLTGMSLLKLYASDVKTGNESVSLGGYLAYIMSNQDDTTLEDANAFELGVDGTYKITENLKYNLGVAYASVSYDEGDDPDPIYTLYHSIKLTF